MNILVDSSIWIDYFRSGKNSELLDDYIEQNLICTNYLVLSEIIPSLKIKKQSKLIKLLYSINRISLKPDWEKIIDLQAKCLKNGINKVGIPDLIILDNVLQNDLTLYTLDNHFFLIQKFVQFNIVK